MNPAWTIRTGRLVLAPVSWRDLPGLTELKADPRVYAVMLGGVRSPVQTAQELVADIAFWAARGVGMWAARDGAGEGPLLGIAGLHERADGRGIALRFAFRAEVRGRGLAREAAGAALRFAHDRAGVPRVVAVARESNFSSRTVLGAIGMRPYETFLREGHRMVSYESLAPAPREPAR